MFKYMVFAFQQYYPVGGGNDFKRAFEDFDQARAYAQALLSAPAEDEVLDFTPVECDEDEYGRYDWAEVYEFDATTGAMTQVR